MSEPEATSETEAAGTAEAAGETALPGESETARPRRGWRRATIAVVSAIVAIVTIGAALIGTGLWSAAQGGQDQGTAERRAVASLGRQLLAPPAAQPTSIRIPALEYSAPIAALAVGADAVLDPSTAEDAYWLPDYGLAGEGSDNTVYLIGHTSADGRAVFDPLVDRTAGEVAVLLGDEILLETVNGTAIYEIISAERHAKTALADLENAWTNTPGRLVLITCFFDPDGSATDNMVVFARRNGGA